MANVKISAIGLLDMLHFKNMKNVREKRIQSTEPRPLVTQYKSNRKAAERHPESQTFLIDQVIPRGKGDVKTFVLRKKDGTKPSH